MNREARQNAARRLRDLPSLDAAKARADAGDVRASRWDNGPRFILIATLVLVASQPPGSPSGQGSVVGRVPVGYRGRSGPMSDFQEFDILAPSSILPGLTALLVELQRRERQYMAAMWPDVVARVNSLMLEASNHPDLEGLLEQAKELKNDSGVQVKHVKALEDAFACLSAAIRMVETFKIGDHILQSIGIEPAGHMILNLLRIDIPALLDASHELGRSSLHFHWVPDDSPTQDIRKELTQEWKDIKEDLSEERHIAVHGSSHDIQAITEEGRWEQVIIAGGLADDEVLSNIDLSSFSTDMRMFDIMYLQKKEDADRALQFSNRWAQRIAEYLVERDG